MKIVLIAIAMILTLSIFQSVNAENMGAPKIVSQMEYDNAEAIYEETDVKLVEKEWIEYLIVSEHTVMDGELTFEEFQEYMKWSFERNSLFPLFG